MDMDWSSTWEVLVLPDGQELGLFTFTSDQGVHHRDMENEINTPMEYHQQQQIRLTLSCGTDSCRPRPI